VRTKNLYYRIISNRGGNLKMAYYDRYLKIRINEDLLMELREFCKVKGISMSEYIRTLIKEDMRGE